ncbi:MAG: signal peptidase I [Planctomycetaceae bacterium]|nr:signal peptidase I [Planctomycetaceae bacterium]
MSDKKNKAQKSSDRDVKKPHPRRPAGDGFRETVESVAIAFILAFIFKTFQAEAYVIPTGSMAPTLYGRHKEIKCEGCGFEFALGASTEVDSESNYLHSRIRNVYCANCGRKNDAYTAPVFNGDRIIVNKQVSEYHRFDVVVFKNPEEGHVNYIKRLVGLPGETIRIRKGDIWAKANDSDDWKIQRKEDPYVQKDTQLTVYDDQYPAGFLIGQGWPERWDGVQPSTEDGSVGGWMSSPGNWQPNRDDRTYHCEQSSEPAWLRYRHFQPDASVWSAAEELPPLLPAAEAALISDFCSFNAFDLNGNPGHPYWVGDLTVNFRMDVHTAESNGTLVVELVEGPDTFQCSIDLTTGAAELSVLESVSRAESTRSVLATGQTDVAGAGRYDITFANVDDRLCLWIDGDLVEFDRSAEYESSDSPQPTDRDLTPCGIAVQGADLTISQLLLQRDIYYRNDIIPSSDSQDIQWVTPYGPGNQEEVRHDKHGLLQSLLKNPRAWADSYARESGEHLAEYGESGEYRLDVGEYLMFGDNSSMSQDSRLFFYQARPLNRIFSHRYAVREQDLIGKALFIFWPHGVPFLNGGKGIAVKYHSGDKAAEPDKYPSVRVPFYPNVGRMKKIR